MYTYKFNFFTALRLRREAKRNDKLVSIKSEQLQTSCINSLQKLIYRTTNSMEAAVIGIKTAATDLGNFLEDGDKFGRKIPVHFPILTPSELSIHRKAVRLNFLWMILMVLAEVGLYYIVSPYFIPQMGNVTLTIIMRMAASFVFAIAIMFAISIGYTIILDYITAKHLYTNGEITEDRFRRFKMKQRIGVVLVIFGFGAIIVMAVIRHLMLRSSVNPNLITDELLRNSAIRRASSASWAAIFACALAIIFGILLAVSKNEAQQFAILYKVYRQHLSAMTRLHKHMANVSDKYARYKKRFARRIKIACDLVLHLKRLAKREVDNEYKTLATEFTEAKREPGFAVTNDIYLRFNDIISKDKSLFLFPINDSLSEISAADTHINDLKDEADKLHKFTVDQHSAKGKLGLNDKSPALRKLQTTTLTLLIFATLLIGLSSCGNATKSRLFLLFPDASGSIDYQTKLSYKNNLLEITRIAKPGDKIVVLPIDAGTLNNSTELLTITMPDEDRFKDETDPPQEAQILESERFNEYLKQQVAKFNTSMNEYLSRNQYRNGTDIVGAFDISMLYKVDTSKYIPIMIIMSDGLNCTPELNLEKGFGNQSPSPQLLSVHNKINLQDWHVFFLTGNNPGMSEKRYLYVKSFWINFMTTEKIKPDNIFYASGANSVLLTKIKDMNIN